MSIENPKKLFQGLIALREKLGFDLVEHSFNVEVSSISEIEIQLESEDGITVSAEEIEVDSSTGLLTYSGHLVIVYISDTYKSEEYLKNNDLLRPDKSGKLVTKGPKFHFTWCRTLENMKKRKRYERYVMLRNKDNKFKVQARDDRHSDAYVLDETVRLFPCMNCLAGCRPSVNEEFGYDGYSKRWPLQKKYEASENFDIGTFLDENYGTLKTILHSSTIKQKPKHTDRSVGANNYTADFVEISKNLRREHNWICSKCGVDMSQKKKGLQVHHMNGIKNDNSKNNLQVICALCHKNIDESHSTIHVDSDIKKFILQARKNVN